MSGAPAPNPWSREASEGSSSWEQPAQTWEQPAQTWEQPAHTWEQPAQTWEQPAHTWEQPAQTWEQPAHTWEQPAPGMNEMPGVGSNPYLPDPYQQPVGPYGSQPLSYAPYALAVAPDDKPNSRGGLTGLLLAGGAMLLSIVLSIISGQSGSSSVAGELSDSDSATLGLIVLVQLSVCTGLGIAGLIVSAVNMKYQSQKKFAVWGLVIALVAPVLSFIIFVTIYTLSTI